MRNINKSGDSCLPYYVTNLFENRYALLRSTGYRICAIVIALLAAAYTQYVALEQSVLSPATLAILGGATGLFMVIAHSFGALKVFTVLNALLWSSYCVLVGSYGNLVGNAFVLGGVAVAVWKHDKEHGYFQKGEVAST